MTGPVTRTADPLEVDRATPAAVAWPRWVAGLCVAFAVTAALVDTACMALRGHLVTEFGVIDHGWPIIPLTGVVSTVMGALVVTRDRRQPIGWLLLVPGVTTTLALALDAYSGWVLLDAGPGPMVVAVVCSWLASFLGAQIPFAANAVILLLAPDGRLIGRTRGLAVAAAIVGCLLWSAPTVLEAAVYAQTEPRPSALGQILFVAGLVLVDAAVLAGVVSLFVRRRREHAVARVQIQWFVVAAVPFAGSIVWLLLTGYVLHWPRSAATHLPLFLAELVFPLAIAVAVLRYRLYDITVVLNRAWLLLGTTAVVGTAYVLLVGTIGGSLPGFWPAVLASAVVACLFQPIRSRIVAVADRLAYGDRLEPYEALAELVRRLGESAGADATLAEIAAAGRRATGAEAVTIELYGESGDPVAVARDGAGPPGSPPAHHLRITDGRTTLGLIRVVPAPGRPLRRRDRVALADLSAQAGLVFRNLRLEAGRQARIEELARIGEQLRASYDRLAAARAQELRRLELTVRESISPILQRLGEGLTALAGAPPSSRDGRWNELSDEVGHCLAALRALSHGVHSDVLDSLGLPAALAARLRQAGSGARLTVSGDLSRRPPSPAVAAAMERCVMQALAAGPRILHIVVGVVDDALEVRLTGPTGTAIPLTIGDVVDSVGGRTVVGEKGWVLHFPVPPAH